MTVQELVEKLYELDPNATIVIPKNESGYTIEAETVFLNEDGKVQID